MPNYRVTLFYNASASYEVEAADEDSAVEKAHAVSSNEPDLDFSHRLNLDFTDADVEEDEEEMS